MTSDAEEALRATWCAVLNPISGGGRGLRQRGRIEAALRAHGVMYRMHVSEHAGHAVEKLVGDAVSECLLDGRPACGVLTLDETRDCLLVR